MSQAAIEKFRQIVFTDQALQHQLRVIEDQLEFVAVVIRLANEQGFEITAEDVEESLRAARRAWIERWV